MKRLGRWLFHLAAMVSTGALATILFISLGVQHESVVLARASYGEVRFVVTAVDGGVELIRITPISPPLVTVDDIRKWQMQQQMGRHFSRFGFSLNVAAVTHGRTLSVAKPAPIVGTAYALRVPYWPMTIVLAIIPASWLRARWRLRNLRKQNRCLRCGYDLRATPQRCPECGLVPVELGRATS